MVVNWVLLGYLEKSLLYQEASRTGSEGRGREIVRNLGRAFYQEECVGCLRQQLIQKVIFRGGEVCSWFLELLGHDGTLVMSASASVFPSARWDAACKTYSTRPNEVPLMQPVTRDCIFLLYLSVACMQEQGVGMKKGVKDSNVNILCFCFT